MLTDSLIKLYNRDLENVAKEINLYGNETDIWKTADGINNSAGNLVLHLLGNLNTYIGKNLGGHDYVRDRPAEFSLKNIPKSELLSGIESIKVIIEKSLTSLKSEDLDAIYPEETLGYPMSTEYFLCHILAHLNYHLGQINYHRRLVGNV